MRREQEACWQAMAMLYPLANHKLLKIKENKNFSNEIIYDLLTSTRLGYCLVT